MVKCASHESHEVSVTALPKMPPTTPPPCTPGQILNITEKAAVSVSIPCLFLPVLGLSTFFCPLTLNICLFMAGAQFVDPLFCFVLFTKVDAKLNQSVLHMSDDLLEHFQSSWND